MSSPETLRPLTPQLQELLELDRDLACLQYYVVAKLVDWKPAPGLIVPEAGYGDRLVTASAEVAFRSNALAQATDRDTVIDDELAWGDRAQEGYESVGRRITAVRSLKKLSLFAPRNEIYRRLDYHIMQARQRTASGERVINPFGPDYAARVATREVILPTEVAPVTVEDVMKIESKSYLKAALLERLDQH